jgi:uncharacterized protein (DUF433 family)
MVRPVRSLRLPEPLQQELDFEFASRGVREWSAGMIELLTEAIRMRRVPGIIFVDSSTGRRPAVAGAGVDVWEIVATWKVLGQDDAKIYEAYDWLNPTQLGAALAYYRRYPEEIDERIALEERWTPEEVRRTLPLVSPGPFEKPEERTGRP